MLQVENLNWSYGAVNVLDNLSFQVAPGSILGILGENGAGKSTLLRLLAGITLSSEGTLQWKGRNPVSEGPLYRENLAFLPEGAPVHSYRKLGEYLESAASMFRRSPEELRQLAIIGRLEEVWNKPMGKLSRGFRQRTGLVHCLLQKPDLLLLDEPFSGLDPKQILRFRRLLQEEASHRITLFSSHVLPEVYALSDRIILLRQGRMEGFYSRSDFKSMEELEALFQREPEKGIYHES